MADRVFTTVDGNEAAARIAHLTNEVIAIYPITPASPMGELADHWTSRGNTNIFGTVPEVIEMQSEAGAAGAVHGALQAGALTTTFTASQGLLLMIPDMFKIAGELTPAVFHIAARSVATHALSIFGDHSDVMACRSTGWAMLAANSVEEAQDFALIAQAATLESRVPFLHFFDGFRTSHEVNKIEQLSIDDVRWMMDKKFVQAHRHRALSPDHPVLRGSAQNPDVFFQAREAANPFYAAVSGVVQATMNRFASRIGRQYHLFDYVGDPAARRVIVMMGSGVGAAEEAIERFAADGESVGLIKVRLYRPFDTAAFLGALPKTVERIAVLDRTKEPGAIGEPLYLDVVTALSETASHNGHRVEAFGGRYGLASKEFTPAMVAAVFEHLNEPQPKRHFTIGIYDDVTHLSLKWDPNLTTEGDEVTRAVFYGLGSDGTVGANKNSVKIIGENTPLFAQGYFVYDSKKSGAVTVSHLRFGPRPIRSTYLIDRANFVACHQFHLLETMDVLKIASEGATFLLNSPYPADRVWEELPREVQQHIIDKRLKFYVVDGYGVARDTGMGARINTAMQSCFFALAGILPREEAIDHIKSAIRKTYGRRGESIVEQNFAAIDLALARLQEVAVPQTVTSTKGIRTPAVPVASHAGTNGDSALASRVTASILAGRGDLLPVSAMTLDGTFPTGTAKFEKRSIAHEIPTWDPTICIDCGLCALVCPHAAIRMKVFPEAELISAPDTYQWKPWKDKELAGHALTIQVAPDDCTGCGVCVDVCPAKSKEVVRHKAINMETKESHLDRERDNFNFFLDIPEFDRTKAKIDVVKGCQILEPLFEFSGACAGCGETPYLKLMSQLFGDRAIIANATGCSSIYGGNLPTTPWTTNKDGRGPAWCNSLFEDNAEFGLGIRLAADQQRDYAETLLKELASHVGDGLVAELLASNETDEVSISAQRERVARLKATLASLHEPKARELASVADALVRRSVWIVGGDGWAYDIGFGGLDHVLTTNRDVNILVLDTGVYSNTGGQASKATPRAAMAKFAANGKAIRKKDLGMLAVSYGNVYVAQIALGANPNQTLRAFLDAESYRGPSLSLAYSQCIAHGINMTQGMTHLKTVVQTGLWPLYRFDPRLAHAGEHPFHLDSRKPTIPFKELAEQEARFAMVARSDSQNAERLFALAQKDIDDQWHFYEQMAGIERDISSAAGGDAMRASLTTQYLGLSLKNPIVASAGPLTGEYDSLRRLEEHGIAAAVFPSLFEEQICRDEQRLHALYEYQTFASAESLSYFPKAKEYHVGPREYLNLLEKAADKMAIPVIGSLNGSTPGGWVRYAKLMESAGADALELNIYIVATDAAMTAADVEQRYVDLVAIVRDAVKIPVAVKIGPQFSNLTNFVPRLAQAGADGAVLFNRFLEPDIDLESMRLSPQLVLSSRHEMRAALRWIAILRDQVSMSLGATGGIHYPEDVIKLLLVGADACLLTSTLLRHGPEYVDEMLRTIQDWLDAREYESVEQLKGSMSYGNCPDAGNLERANYMKAIVSYTAG